MKKFNLILALVAVVFAVVSCDTKKEEPKKKALVLYYSQTSNTKTVAQEIAKLMEADIEEIVPVKPYDGDFQTTIDRCSKERDEGISCEIKPISADITKYDVIFLGFPVWFGTYAPPVAAFLDQADLSGKKVVPFCTFGSGGLDSSVKDLAKKQPKAEILPGYGVRAARMAAVPKEVDQFLKEGGLIEGEFTKLEAFAEEHPVSKEESDIFDAATKDYPMMHAQAKTVATRNIPGGVEYLFTAVDLPREDNQQAPPPGELKVYVTKLEGATPEFTQVVR